MDHVEPRPPKRSSARPSGSSTRSSGPADPRQESPTGGTPRPPSQRAVSGNGKGNGKGSTPAKRPAKRPTPPVTEVVLPGGTDDRATTTVAVALAEPSTDTVEADGATAIDARTEQLAPPEPIVIPTIVPAEPEVPLETGDTDGTGGLPSMRRSPKPPRALRAPVVVPRRRRPRVRRVTRVVRHVDTWSVFKVALVFNLFLYAVCLTAGVLLWQVAVNTGTVDNVERFFESFGWETFELKGGEIYHNAWIAGLFVIVGFTGLAVLAATLFNLITDLVGGIRVSVLEEEVVAREDRGLAWRPGRRARRTAEPLEPHDPVEPVVDPLLGGDATVADPAHGDARPPG